MESNNELQLSTENANANNQTTIVPIVGRVWQNLPLAFQAPEGFPQAKVTRSGLNQMLLRLTTENATSLKIVARNCGMKPSQAEAGALILAEMGKVLLTREGDDVLLRRLSGGDALSHLDDESYGAFLARHGLIQMEAHVAGIAPVQANEAPIVTDVALPTAVAPTPEKTPTGSIHLTGYTKTPANHELYHRLAREGKATPQALMAEIRRMRTEGEWVGVFGLHKAIEEATGRKYEPEWRSHCAALRESLQLEIDGIRALIKQGKYTQARQTLRDLENRAGLLFTGVYKTLEEAERAWYGVLEQIDQAAERKDWDEIARIWEATKDHPHATSYLLPDLQRRWRGMLRHYRIAERVYPKAHELFFVPYSA